MNDAVLLLELSPPKISFLTRGAQLVTKQHRLHGGSDGRCARWKVREEQRSVSHVLASICLSCLVQKVCLLWWVESCVCRFVRPSFGRFLLLWLCRRMNRMKTRSWVRVKLVSRTFTNGLLGWTLSLFRSSCKLSDAKSARAHFCPRKTVLISGVVTLGGFSIFCTWRLLPHWVCQTIFFALLLGVPFAFSVPCVVLRRNVWLSRVYQANFRQRVSKGENDEPPFSSRNNFDRNAQKTLPHKVNTQMYHVALLCLAVRMRQ